MPLAALTPADIPEVMRIERQPGYDLVGKWTAEEHAAEMASPDARYFGLREGDGLMAFVILQKAREPSIRLRRIAVSAAERGVGTMILRAAMDWVFETTPAQALHLDVHVRNDRARHVYEREGFVAQGQFEPDHTLMEIPRADWVGRRAG